MFLKHQNLDYHSSYHQCELCILVAFYNNCIQQSYNAHKLKYCSQTMYINILYKLQQSYNTCKLKYMYNFLVCLLTLFPDLGPLLTYLFIYLLVPYSTMQSFLHLAPCVETKNNSITLYLSLPYQYVYLFITVILIALPAFSLHTCHQ